MSRIAPSSPIDRATQPQPQVRGHLVVARPPRVEPPGQRADPLPKRRLEVHVDVLERRVPHDRSGLHLAAQPLQAADERGHFVVGQETGPAEPMDVRYRAGDVVDRQGAVDLDRAREVGHSLVRRAFESTAPESHGSSSVAPLTAWYRVRRRRREPATSAVARRRIRRAADRAGRGQVVAGAEGGHACSGPACAGAVVTPGSTMRPTSPPATAQIPPAPNTPRAPAPP